MIDKRTICIYYNEHLRCYYDGTIERFRTKNGTTTIRNPRWKIIKNVSDNYGYNKIGIEKKMYLRHRIIAFCYYGNFDLNDTSIEIDHRDGNGLNNSVENLKVGTKIQNSLNKKGAKNYSWIIKANRWVVNVSVSGKQYYGGLFKIGEEIKRDEKIKELKDKYQKPIYESSLKDIVSSMNNSNEYSIIIEQLKEKIKELEMVITNLQNSKSRL
jgi:hypothetical protein